MEAAKDVSFTKPMKLLANGGNETLAAWGMIILINACLWVIPIEAAASHCPLGIEVIAARIVSEAYAPVLSEKTIIPDVNGSNFIPSGASPLIFRYGNPKYTINNWFLK